MGVMMLAAEYGATITLRATGEDCEGALDALCAVIANKFGESDVHGTAGMPASPGIVDGRSTFSGGKSRTFDTASYLR